MGMPRPLHKHWCGVEKCPVRVVIAKFKNGWTKNTWGPPTKLDYDVLKTNSIKWPYQIIISYTILWTGTEDQKNVKMRSKTRSLRSR
jgi:hypothetical protein